MANIAFFCIPAQGHTNPTLGVVRELDAGAADYIEALLNKEELL